ncbi:MAG: NAD(P)/FAD-dependent oxidoreductase, partial [Turicibacter sanguinis]
IKASAVVLAMGCRENNRQALSIPGTRPVGILTAGTAQRYLNLDGYLVGKKVFIVGSGDIGLIMARRMALEGAEVLGVAEIMPYSNGLTRNIVQCLEDFNIPLFLSHTVTDIKGNRRVEGVTISEVDADRQPILGTEKQFEVDAILFSVGLIPDNGLSKKAGVIFDPATKGACVFENLETTVSGIFACGNVLHVHDLVDFVSDEAERAGYYAALYALGHLGHDDGVLEVKAGEGIKYALPQKIRPKELEASLELMYRVTKKYQQAIVNVVQDGKIVHQLKRHVLLPAEMEKIKIPTEVLNSSGKDLTIEVKCLYNS